MKHVLLATLLLLPLVGRAATIEDATGRTVTMPDRILHVLPAGPPAAVLMAALAPDLMLGWPGSAPGNAAAFLVEPAADLGAVPRVTGQADVTAEVTALHPDLILDYGTVSPRYTALDAETQRRTGIPTVLLDGALTNIPATFQQLGRILHREARANALAELAKSILAAVPPTQGDVPSVVYARGAEGLQIAAPGSGVVEVFTLLGWRVLAPLGEGNVRTATIEQIAALDPDWLVFGDAGMRDVVEGSPAWQGLRAVRTGHARVAPATPFGWMEEPPSVNRLLGVAMLTQPEADMPMLQHALFGRSLDAAQRKALSQTLRPLAP